MNTTTTTTTTTTCQLVRTLFYGNPGTGKSSLINTYLHQAGKEPQCKSGYSDTGGGVTSVYQEIECTKDEILLDTPGIADLEMNEEACKQIKKALQLGGNYRLLFICTLESGRVKPEDCVTINRVTEAIKVPEFFYSLAVNKVSVKGMKKTIQNAAAFELFLDHLTTKPKHIFFIKFSEDAQDEDNYLMKEPSCYDALLAVNEGELTEAKSFRQLVQSTKYMVINKTQVDDIKTLDYSEEVERLKAIISQMRKDHLKQIKTLEHKQQIFQEANKKSQMQLQAEIQRLRDRPVKVIEKHHHHHHKSRGPCSIS